MACYLSGRNSGSSTGIYLGIQEEDLTPGSLAPHPDSAERSGELLYARIVDEVGDGGLSNAEVAQVIGVAERQVRNWSGGTNAPSGRNRDRLLELHYLVGLLREVYTREGAEIWLHGRKKSLEGRRPIDLLENDESEVVLDAIERLRAGAM